MGAHARRRPSRARWRPYSKIEVDSDIKPWFAVYFFDFGHPCYDQLTPVKTGYSLTSITCSYRRIKFTAHRGHMFFLKLITDQLLVFRLDHGLMSG